MSELTDELLAKGYKKHVSETYNILKSTSILYQKRITDGHGTRYFINAWYYDSDLVKDTVQFDVQFTMDDDQVVDVCLPTNDIDFAEAEFDRIWTGMLYNYYGTWDEP